MKGESIFIQKTNNSKFNINNMAIWENLSPAFKSSITISLGKFSRKTKRQNKIKNIFKCL